MAAALMPRFFALRWRWAGMFLQFTTWEAGRQRFHKFLEVTGRFLVTPYTKFEAEASEKDPELFHLKSCFNNKYWVRHSQFNPRIVAAADEIEEDRSKWSCTLFRPFTESGVFYLQHVSSGQFVIIHQFEDLYARLGSRGGSGNDGGFVMFDWESLIFFPRYVAFRGDNGKYLATRVVNGNNHLQFSSDNNDGSDRSVIHEVFYSHTGSVRFLALEWERYWITTSTDDGWILANSVNGPSNSIFTQERDGINTVVLRTHPPSNFVCRRFTDHLREHCLRAPDNSVLGYSKLMFEECVKSRQIVEIQYHAREVRFHDGRSIRGDAVVAKNYDANTSDNATLRYTFTKTISSTWSYSNSVSTGVSASVKGRIPFVGKVGTELSISYTHSRETSETSSISEQIEASYEAVVPPGHMISIFGIVEQVAAYLPFSYTQIDTLWNGRRVSTRKDDGVYHVQNGFDFFLSRTAPVPLNTYLQ